MKFIQLLTLACLCAATSQAQDVPGNLTNLGDTKVIADNDSDGHGAVELQTKLTTRLKVKNDGKIHVFTKLGVNSTEFEPLALIDFGVTDNETIISVAADDQDLKFQFIKGRYTNNAKPISNQTFGFGWNMQVVPGQATFFEAFEGNWCPTPTGECVFERYVEIVLKNGLRFRPWGGQVGKESGYTSWHETVNERSISGKDGAGFGLLMSSQGVSLSKTGGYVSIGEGLQVGGGDTSVRLRVDPAGRIHIGQNTPTWLELDGLGLWHRDGTYNRGFKGGSFTAFGDTGTVLKSQLDSTGVSLADTSGIRWANGTALSTSGTGRVTTNGAFEGIIRGTGPLNLTGLSVGVHLGQYNNSIPQMAFSVSGQPVPWVVTSDGDLHFTKGNVQMKLSATEGLDLWWIGGLKVNGTKVVGSQCAAIPNSNGTQADDTRAINAVLGCMRQHGLISQ